MAEILGNTVRERRRKMLEYGTDYEGKPVCILASFLVSYGIDARL